jgi:hypothetical protein
LAHAEEAVRSLFIDLLGVRLILQLLFEVEAGAANVEGRAPFEVSIAIALDQMIEAIDDEADEASAEWTRLLAMVSARVLLDVSTAIDDGSGPADAPSSNDNAPGARSE